LILVIGVVHWLLPADKINKKLFPIETIDEMLEYSESSRKFDTVH